MRRIMSLYSEMGNERKREKKISFWIAFIFGLLLTFGGAVFQINGTITETLNYKEQPLIVNSYTMFFGGFICFLCSYFLFKKLMNK